MTAPSLARYEYPGYSVTKLAVAVMQSGLLSVESFLDDLSAQNVDLRTLDPQPLTNRLLRYAIETSALCSESDLFLPEIEEHPLARVYSGIFDAVCKSYEALKKTALNSLDNFYTVRTSEMSLANLTVAQSMRKGAYPTDTTVALTPASAWMVGHALNLHPVAHLSDFMRSRQTILNRMMPAALSVIKQINQLTLSTEIDNALSADRLRFGRNKILATFNATDVLKMLPGYVVQGDNLIRARVFAHFDVISHGTQLPGPESSDFMTAFRAQVFDLCVKKDIQATEATIAPLTGEDMKLILADLERIGNELEKNHTQKCLSDIFAELDATLAFCDKIVKDIRTATIAGTTIDDETLRVFREHLSIVSTFATWTASTLVSLEAVTRLADSSAMSLISESLAVYK